VGAYVDDVGQVGSRAPSTSTPRRPAADPGMPRRCQRPSAAALPGFCRIARPCRSARRDDRTPTRPLAEQAVDRPQRGAAKAGAGRCGSAGGSGCWRLSRSAPRRLSSASAAAAGGGDRHRGQRLSVAGDRRAQRHRSRGRRAARIGGRASHRQARVARRGRGQRVAEGEIIARLENRDVAATREQAAAGVRAARPTLVQGQARLADAAVGLKRSREWAEDFVSSPRSTPPRRASTRRRRRSSPSGADRVAQATCARRAWASTRRWIRAPFKPASC